MLCCAARVSCSGQLISDTAGHNNRFLFWIESIVRDDSQRRLLFNLDMTILGMRERDGDSDTSVRLTGTYHNRMRMRAQT
ncbi:MAG: hypothetical protein ABIO19_08415 [Burkholderiaceae bacterium]